MLSIPQNNTSNHMNAIRSRLNPESSIYQQWIQRRILREQKQKEKKQKEKKREKLRKQSQNPPPKYEPPPNYYTLPNIPPPPYESYEDYCKRTNKTLH